MPKHVALRVRGSVTCDRKLKGMLFHKTLSPPRRRAHFPTACFLPHPHTRAHTRRVPLPTWAMVLVLTPATLLLFAVLALPIINRNWVVVWWTAATIVLGFVMYPLLQLAKRRGW